MVLVGESSGSIHWARRIFTPEAHAPDGAAREINKELIGKSTLKKWVTIATLGRETRSLPPQKQDGRETSLHTFLGLWVIFTMYFNFKNCLNKLFGFGRLRGESHD